MAFDAGMLRFILHEIECELKDGKIEKIYEPVSGEIVLQIKKDGVKRLLINAGSSAPRICITDEKTENPANPPMFCMLMRKHLSGGRLTEVVQEGFERVARFTFDVYDEMGFPTKRSIYAEIMGKYSNIILTDDKGKILGATRIVDFSQSVMRQILPGMTYELPPPQDKTDLTAVSEGDIRAMVKESDADRSAAKFITSSFLGISSGNASQIVYEACGDADATVGEAGDMLIGALTAFSDILKNYRGNPYLVRNADGVPVDFSFVSQRRYGKDFTEEICDGFGELVTRFYRERAREERLRQSGSDIIRLLSNAEARIERKRAVQTEELLAAEDAEKFRLWGDLITANIYMLKRGFETAVVEDYYTGDMVEIPLDTRLAPAANAQKYYKKYTKAKTAADMLRRMLDESADELVYLATVRDALSRAETEKELSEIRQELRQSGYASRMKQGKDKKNSAPTVLRFITSGGYEVLCGKNNIANEYITFRLADRDDWWFHVKNMPGSHVIMRCSPDDDPPEKDFTEAATIAAVYSKAADGASVPVDYTKVRYVKKPPASKPGFVTYSKNWSAFVTPDEALVKTLLTK